MSCLTLTSKKMERVLYFEADISWPSYLSSCLSSDCAVFISFSGVFYAAFIFHLMNGLELIGDTKLFSRRKLSESSPLWELKRKLIYSSPSQSSLVPRTFPLAFERAKTMERPWKRGCLSIHFYLDTQSPLFCVGEIAWRASKASKEFICLSEWLLDVTKSSNPCATAALVLSSQLSLFLLWLCRKENKT